MHPAPRPLALALAALAALVCVVAQAPCNPGFTYFPDLELTEEAAQTAGARYSGSCIRLYRRADLPFNASRPTRVKTDFATFAAGYCSYPAGGHLLAFGSVSTSQHGMLSALRRVMANASSEVVLIGGRQNPSAKGSQYSKMGNWVWATAEVSRAILAAPKSWATDAGQPDDKGLNASAPVPAFESGAANVLAIHRSSLKFYDVSTTDEMDIICQYRAPAPCPKGFRLFASVGDSSNATIEYGMSSCINVFAPATLEHAADACASFGAPVTSDVAGNPALKYKHLATYHNLSGAGYTPLTSFAKTLAAVRGVTGPLFWTGAELRRNGSTGYTNVWLDGHVFDSVVANNSVPVTDNTVIVLSLNSSKASLQYFQRTPATQLPYVCEVDIGVRLSSQVTDPSFGLLVSYARVSTVPNGTLVCGTGYTTTTSVVACRQAGFDGGALLAMASGSDGNIVDRVTLSPCGGQEDYVEDCVPSWASPVSECSDPIVPQVKCDLAIPSPGAFPYPPVSLGPGDFAATSSSDYSARNSAIIVIVVVLGVLLVILVVVQTIVCRRAARRAQAQAAATPTPA